MADQRFVVQDSLDETMDSHTERASNSPEDFTILITGFGPFKEKYPINPSYEIAARLPSSVSHPANKSSNINLMVHHPAVRVSYDNVRITTPNLYNTRKVDFALHIGMADSRNYYSIESQAHKRGYNVGDVDGRLCSYASDGRKLSEMPTPAKNINDKPELKVSELMPGVRKPSVIAGYTDEWGDQTPPPSDLKSENAVQESHQDHGVGDRIVEDWTSLPDVLHPIVDMQRVLRNWDAEMDPKTDLRVSSNAGRYLCEYIYYCSLAHRVFSGPGQGKVLFLHVPGSSDEADISIGVKVVLALCKSIALEMSNLGKVAKDRVNENVKMEVERAHAEDKAGDGKFVRMGVGEMSDRVEDARADELVSGKRNLEDIFGTGVEERSGGIAVQEDSNMGTNVEGVRKGIASAKLKPIDDTEPESFEGSDWENIVDEMSEDEDLERTMDTMENTYVNAKVGKDLEWWKTERGRRGHTNRDPGQRWQIMKERRKAKRLAEDGAATATQEEGGEDDHKKEIDKGKGKEVGVQKEENRLGGEDSQNQKQKQNQRKGKRHRRGKKSEESTSGPRTSEATHSGTTKPKPTIVDKQYLGYVMSIPVDEPFAD